MIITPEIAIRLLDQFYAGTTTVEEEQVLQHFLFSENCPESLFADREIMRILSCPAEVNVPDGLEQRIMKKLRRRRFNLRLFTIPTGMAAAIAALFVFVNMTRHLPLRTIYTDTCDTPQEAVVETQKTLVYISHNINIGLEEMDDELGGPCP